MTRPRNDKERDKILRYLRDHPRSGPHILVPQCNTNLGFAKLIRREFRNLKATYSDDPEGWFCEPCRKTVLNGHPCPYVMTPWQRQEVARIEREEEEERARAAVIEVEERKAKIREMRSQSRGEDTAAALPPHPPPRRWIPRESFVQEMRDRADFWSHFERWKEMRSEAFPDPPIPLDGEYARVSTPSLDAPPTIRESLISLAKAITTAENQQRTPEEFASEVKNAERARLVVHMILAWMTQYERALAVQVEHQDEGGNVESGTHG